MAARFTAKLSGALSFYGLPDKVSATAAGSLDATLSGEWHRGGIRDSVTSAGFVALNLPSGKTAKLLRVRPCCGSGTLSVRVTFAVSATIVLKPRTDFGLLLSVPDGDLITGVEVSSGAADATVEFDWNACG